MLSSRIHQSFARAMRAGVASIMIAGAVMTTPVAPTALALPRDLGADREASGMLDLTRTRDDALNKSGWDPGLDSESALVVQSESDMWHALGDGLDGTVLAVAVSGNDVYVGGTFTTAGEAPASRVAHWDGTQWHALGTGVNSTVHAIAVSEGDVYVGGSFTMADGTAANGVARWDGAQWHPLGAGVNGSVRIVTVSGSDVYVGGSFTAAGGKPANRIARWDGTEWHALGTGTSDTVRAIAVNGSDVYAGGWFSQAGGVAARSIARWDGEQWHALGTGTDNPVYAVAVSGNAVYAGGALTNAGGVQAKFVARWDGVQWHALGDGLDGTVLAVAASENDVYVGGSFTMAGGEPSSHIARWDGAQWHPLGDGLDDTTEAVVVSGSDIYFGGDFTNAGGVPASRIVRHGPTAPEVTSLPQTTFTVGVAEHFTITATGVPVPSITCGGALPSGITFSDHGDGTAALAGTAAAGSGDIYYLTLTADNDVTPEATHAFTLTVQEAPAITSAAEATFTAGSAGAFDITAIGAPTPAVSISGELPAGIAFSDHGDGRATLAGTAMPGSGGIYPITLAANNGVLPDATQAMTLTVRESPTLAGSTEATITVGRAGTVMVTATGAPTPTLTISGSLPEGIRFSDHGDRTATLAGSAAAGSGGVYRLTLTADNGVLPAANQALTLSVHEAPAITSAGEAALTAGSTGTFTIAATGFPIPAISSHGSLPSGITFSGNGDGTATLSGTAAAGSAGVYELALTASNGVAPDVTQTFTLTVHSRLHIPLLLRSEP